MHSFISKAPDTALGGIHYTRFQTPKGARDFVPGEAARKSALEHSLRGLFSRWGYEEVVTPTFEFANVLEQAEGGKAQQLFRFFDRDGNTLVLRPELTTPIARLVATRLRESELPLRLSYVGHVFRYEVPQVGRQREFTQAGVELFGTSGTAADAEVVALADRCLQLAGLHGFRIDIGHVGYYNGLMEELALDESTRHDLRTALLRRDYVFLEDRVSALNLDPESKERLIELPKLRGREDALARAAAATRNARSLAAVQNLAEIFRCLDAYGIQDRVFIDFGLTKDIEYYTGMVLEGYTRDIGYTLCTGGRYDALVGKFGYPCPATGFAVGVERLLLAQERGGTHMPETGHPREPDVLVLCNWNDAQAGAAAVAAAEAWREKGLRVVMHLNGLNAGLPEVSDAGHSAGLTRAAKVAVFDSASAASGRFLLHERSTSREVSVGELPTSP